MTDSNLENSMTAPIVGTLRDGKIIWKTDELRAKYETPNKPIVQSNQPARAFVNRFHGRYEVIVQETFTHEGVLMARVVFVNDKNEYGIDLAYEIPAAEVEVIPAMPCEKIGDIATAPDYWDCECQRDYIHHKSVPSCTDCGAIREEQPDSRFEEVWALLNF